MEGDDGAQRLQKLISTKASAQMYAERLAELATALGFDGWLLNFEVNADANLIPILEEFVSHLTLTMHSSVPGSLVIWYDSITTDGYLNWQNQLNDSNKPFFDRCDGILVNYFWEEDYVKISADAAGDRKFDVYMGVDVFGRGTYGGGEWNTHVALDVMKKNDVSAAIYAPGWVYETKQPPDFQTAQNRWWGLVEKSWGILQKYPKALPFYSNFDQGHGYHISVDGQQVWNSPWNNISSQSFQEASYSGGGNITFKGTLGENPEFMARLFQGELLLGNFPVHFTYSVKSSGSSLLGLALKSSNATNEKRSIFLAAHGNTSLPTNHFSSQFTEIIMPHRVTTLEADPGWIMQECSINMKGQILREIRAVCYTSKHRKADDQYYAILGDIKFTKSGEITTFPPSASWLVDGQFISWASGPNGSKLLSVKITWKLKDGSADAFTKYNVYVSKLTRARDYVGVALVKTFYVSNLEVASSVSSLKFVIQVCGLDGSCQKLEDSPFFLLPVQG
ncbi:cytosolic endo-beta-n-acetylglucosaminidase [Phtheirospermum japonicum]|uniref:mannosyl-glycoprotein endo-beta-N-acetylglucosaminidase n=1 Tax=Phtheirospermum japonicum TaxID=374723 RepID=A0A830BNM8_9LAMI|nr:cytosolic endo-beta-n-acetylglucosaminidase [Phtheirospermum japonicum]